MNGEQRHRLHAENERLIDAALARLVPAFQSAPDGDECAGKAGQPTRDAAEKTRAYVRQRSRLQRTTRPAQEKIATIGNEHAPDDGAIRRIWKMQQQIDAGRHAEEAADQEDAEIAPIDRTP